MKYKNTRKCKWCGGVASKLMYQGEYCLWDTDIFYFDKHNKVKVFICLDCGKVQLEDYEEKRYVIHLAEV